MSDQTRLSEGVILLRRNSMVFGFESNIPENEKTDFELPIFERVVAPADPRNAPIARPSRDEFETRVSGRGSSNRIRIKCWNDTPYALDVFLYPWEPDGGAKRAWVKTETLETGDSIIHEQPESDNKVLYFIYGSTLAKTLSS